MEAKRQGHLYKNHRERRRWRWRRRRLGRHLHALALAKEAALHRQSLRSTSESETSALREFSRLMWQAIDDAGGRHNGRAEARGPSPPLGCSRRHARESGATAPPELEDMC